MNIEITNKRNYPRTHADYDVLFNLAISGASNQEILEFICSPYWRSQLHFDEVRKCFLCIECNQEIYLQQCSECGQTRVDCRSKNVAALFEGALMFIEDWMMESERVLQFIKTANKSFGFPLSEMELIALEKIARRRVNESISGVGHD